MSAAHQPEVNFLPFMGSDCAQIFGQIVSRRVKKLSSTNLLEASRHIKREKAPLPVGVRCSKMSLLKLHNVLGEGWLQQQQQTKTDIEDQRIKISHHPKMQRSQICDPLPVNPGNHLPQMTHHYKHLNLS